MEIPEKSGKSREIPGNPPGYLNPKGTNRGKSGKSGKSSGNRTEFAHNKKTKDGELHFTSAQAQLSTTQRQQASSDSFVAPLTYDYGNAKGKGIREYAGRGKVLQAFSDSSVAPPRT